MYGVFTNNHVLGSQYEAENADATFLYEGSSGGVKVKLRPEIMFKTSKVSTVHSRCFAKLIFHMSVLVTAYLDHLLQKL